MIDKIIGYSVQNKVGTAIAIFFLILWGVYSATQLPLDAVPDITDNQVQVITASPDLAAQEVERLITFPLETALSATPGSQNIRSVSRFGLSVITVVFEEDVDTYLARQLVQERINEVGQDIPPEIGIPKIGPMSTGLGMIYQYVVKNKEGQQTHTPTELRTYQDWLIKRQLLQVKGVIEVNSSGGFVKQYEVALNPIKLAAVEVEIAEVMEALSANNESLGGSYIENERQTLFIRGEGLIKSEDEIGEIVIKNRGGIPILISDVGKVQTGQSARFGAVTADAQGEVVLGQVMMLKGENAAAVTERVKEKMQEIETALPEGVVIEPFLDRTELVNKTIRTVSTNLIEGGLIVILILVLLLGNLRAGLIVASVIPLSMLFAVGMMNLFGVTANLMSLGAIDFGLIVDGAAIIVESIVFRLGRVQGALSRTELNQEVINSSSKIRKSAAFGEIIILIVYLPILSLGGIEGKMFRPMALTVSFAILGALILSLTYVPMMASWVLKQQSKESGFSERFMDFWRRLYEPALAAAFKLKAAIVGAVVVIFVFSLVLLSRIGAEFIPTLEEGDFALHQILPPGSSLKQSVEVSSKLQGMLASEFPAVEKVVTKIGTAEIPTDIMPMEAGDIYVMLKDRNEWVKADSREEMFEEMEKVMNGLPGIKYEFTQPIQMLFNELMTGVRQDIAIKIFGEDMGILLQKGKEVERLLSTIDGVGDIQLEQASGLPQIHVTYKRDQMARYGLSLSEINLLVKAAFAGAKAGLIYEGEKRFDLVVRFEREYRSTLDAINKILIPLENGQQIPLEHVAEVGMKEGPIQISHEEGRRRITLGVNARNRDVVSLVEEIQQRVATDVDLPAGYIVSYGGQFENYEQARERLQAAVPLALGLIFILLYFTFRSFGQALLIFMAVPMSAIGGILSLYLRGMPFSISAGVGFIALFGVAVLNGIVLVGYFNQLKAEGITDIMERIKKGTSVRLRPVLLTAMVASLGFLPMALSTTAGAEVQRPLATVVIGGLLTATLLTLFVIPILYYYLENREMKLAKKAMMLGLVFLSGSMLQAQQVQKTVSLEETVKLAEQNYPSLQAFEWQIKGAEARQKTAWNLPQTQIQFRREEWDGNSPTGIQSIDFIQYMSFPSVYASRKEMFKEQLILEKNRKEIERQRLTAQVASFYIDAWASHETLKKYFQLDSLYRGIEKIAETKLEVGEQGKMSVLSSQLARQENLLHLQEAEGLSRSADQLLNLVAPLGDTLIVPDDEFDLKHLAVLIKRDTALSPSVQLALQQNHVDEANVKIQNHMRLPGLIGGFFLQQLDGESGFMGYQLGMSVPLWGRAQKNMAESANMNALASKSMVANEQLIAQQKILTATNRLNSLEKRLNTLLEEIVPARQELLSLAQTQYELGEVGFNVYEAQLASFLETDLIVLNTRKEILLSYINLLYLQGKL